MCRLCFATEYRIVRLIFVKGFIALPTTKDFIARAANTSLGWALIARIWRLDDKLQRLVRFAERHRAIEAKENFYDRVRDKFRDQEVRHGPFKGLKYGAEESSGSSLIPKLLGSYENELHPWLETVADRQYGTVIDIGCAEGYYAVGLARLLPQARVLAYDTNPAAQASCRRLAQLNGVAERLTLGAFCDPATLRALDLSERTLIICDCEGYEASLFDRETAEHLRRADLMIECHDLQGVPITRTLIEAFENTHDVTVVETTPDHSKALEMTLPELDEEPYPVRLYMVEERRRAPQNFLILQARTSG